MKTDIFIDKLYNSDRKHEPCCIGIPFAKGELTDTAGAGVPGCKASADHYDRGSVRLYDDVHCIPVQTKVTSRYEDGSVRFLFVRFLADIPANRKLTLTCETGREMTDDAICQDYNPLYIDVEERRIRISTVDDQGDEFVCEVGGSADRLFDRILAHGREYSSIQFEGPALRSGSDGRCHDSLFDRWEIIEKGPLCVILQAVGAYVRTDGEEYDNGFECRLTFHAEKPWVEVSWRIINTTPDPLTVSSLCFNLFMDPDNRTPAKMKKIPGRKPDPTGCGDAAESVHTGEEHILHAGNSSEADRIAEYTPGIGIRTIAASSNYRTDYYIGRDGMPVGRLIDSSWLMSEANEHMAEVFYGTFFADCTDEMGGVCATIFQAQQNFPKAVQADGSGITLMLVPSDTEPVVLQSGMAREQKFLLHFHRPEEPVSSLNDRSIVYQMPYRPYVSPEVHRRSGVWPDIFTDTTDPKVELNLVGRADGHCRAYGMLNFGDSYDANYTAQGRGGGRLVWCNNEYDFPHASALLYVKTGIRRFLDYVIASCSHWMDVDVCHFSIDPGYIGGQWEHTAGHTVNGVMVCSHEWVEGLLDYYHLTGDERGLDTALGIGNNVLGLLELPMYANPGESNARETGWALRTLTALYTETHDRKWLEKCERILHDFRVWEEQYGHWLAPYTDNTAIRVGFMISVAIGSLMRYYRIFPDPELKGLILRAVDDMIENCYVKEWGIFYYKELPSLNRPGNNTLILEALTAAYDLSGDPGYLEYGMGTFRNAMEDQPSYNSSKRVAEDAVLVGNTSSKTFAQSMIPIAGFYRAICDAGIRA